MKIKEKDREYKVPIVESIPEDLLSPEEEKVYRMLHSVIDHEEELFSEISVVDEETYFDLCDLQALLYNAIVEDEKDPARIHNIINKLKKKT